MIQLRNVAASTRSKADPFTPCGASKCASSGETLSRSSGPSGSGKSTLLHILGLHDSAWTGEYDFDGQSVHTLDKKHRFELQKKKMGFVFQSYHLLDDLTVYENLEIPLSYRDMPRKDRERHRVRHPRPVSHSGEEGPLPVPALRRPAAAGGCREALVARPELLLADEPTGNLHSDQGREIMELFTRLNCDDGVTIVQVTHSDTNAAYGSRIVRLSDGLLLK